MSMELRPVEVAELPALVEEARADGHLSIGVTHVIEKDGKPVGHLSINGVPVVLWWMHSKETTPLDSNTVFRVLLKDFKMHGIKAALFPCGVNSPYKRYMKDLGFVELCDVTMYMKEI